MKFWLLSDAHFGKYNLDSDKWLNNMKAYFYEFFIPTIIKYSKPGDKFFFLGDLFDNRTSINLKTIDTVIKLFEDLSKIIECHLLLGNHDMYLMNSPDINSVSTVRNINNVFVYEEPQKITIDGLSIVIMPWIHGKDNEKEILEKYKGADLLFCHSDLNGCRTQLYPTRPLNRNILDIDDFAGYGKVYSGHIHIVQEINNFTFVGSPYHLDRNDVENKKGIFVYDTKKKTDFFIENNFSPEFKKINILQESDFKILQEEIKTNNFIDISVSNNLLLNTPHLRLDLDKITNKHKIQNIEFINDIIKENKPTKISNYNKDKTIKDVSFEWINNLKISDETDLFNEIDLKNSMNETIEKCYTLLELNKK
jgi:3',5'-cyclic AMP phosphodiesterase CpdA